MSIKINEIENYQQKLNYQVSKNKGFGTDITLISQ